MSRFSANDCQKLKQLLNNSSFKSSDDLKKNRENNKTKSNEKLNTFKRKTNLNSSETKSNCFKKSKLNQKIIKNKLKSSDNNINKKHLNPKSIKQKFERNERKDKNESIFSSNSKQNFKNRIKCRNFGESHVKRSEELSHKSYSRLCSSQFRSINEYLYSHSSSDANHYLTNDLFTNYHSIYEKIVEKWPQKPIDFIINKIKTYVKEDNKKTEIADIGCGNLPQIKIAFPKAIVHSFDLISLHESIITADMTKLPLDNSQCDFAVFSLSLMATNISDCLSEANRILKTNGRLIIVEVLSRFDGKEESFAKIMSKFGFELNNKQLLPPNSYFIYFEFNKLKNCKKNGLPNVTLKPCVYKPR